MRRLEDVHLPRLDDVRLHDDSEVGRPWGVSPQRQGGLPSFAATSPSTSTPARELGRAGLDVAPFLQGPMHPLAEVDVQKKWSMSLPAARRSFTRRPRVDPLDPPDKSRLLDGYAPLAQRRSLSDPHDLAPFDIGCSAGPGLADARGGGGGSLLELEALRRHCADLEETLRQLRGGDAFAAEYDDATPTPGGEAMCEEVECLRKQLRDAVEREEAAVAQSVRQADLLEEQRELWAAELTSRTAAAHAEAAAAAVRAAEAAELLGAVQARLASEEARCREAEALCEAAQGRARAARARVSAAFAAWEAGSLPQQGDRAAALLAAIMVGWRAQTAEQRWRVELETEKEARVRAQAAEAAAEVERRDAVRRAGAAEAAAAEEAARLRAKVQAAEARLSCADALHEAAVEESERLRRDAEERARNAEARAAAAAAEQQARHRAELAAQAAAAARARDLALQHAAKEAEARLQAEEARAAQALKARSAQLTDQLLKERLARRCAEGGGGEAPALLALSGAVPPPEARARAYRGVAALTDACSKTLLSTVLASWRSVLALRRAVGTVQAKLFAEQAARAAALRAQKLELDTRYMEAEARHRGALRRMRAELAEAETRHADALAAQESEASMRLAAAEADFALALREATRAPVPAAAERRATVGGEDSPADGEDCNDSIGTTAAAVAEARLGEVLRTLRARAEARLAEAEVRHAEALLNERERADMRLAREERRHEEALRVARESAERRAAAAEARHVEALRTVQEAAGKRVQDAEARVHHLQEIMEAAI